MNTTAFVLRIIMLLALGAGFFFDWRTFLVQREIIETQQQSIDALKRTVKAVEGQRNFWKQVAEGK